MRATHVHRPQVRGAQRDVGVGVCAFAGRTVRTALELVAALRPVAERVANVNDNVDVGRIASGLQGRGHVDDAHPERVHLLAL